MSKTNLRFFVLCTTSILMALFASNANADCSLYAEPVGETRIAPNGDSYVAFKVTAKPCKEGCSGEVRYRIYYIDSNGDSSAHFASFTWRSESGEPVRVSKAHYIDHCSESRYSPCKVQHVEITITSCSDR